MNIADLRWLNTLREISHKKKIGEIYIECSGAVVYAGLSAGQKQ